MRIGFVTDELAENLQEALQIGDAWGVSDYELRMVNGRRVPEVEEAALQQLEAWLGRGDRRITALSPGLFKKPISDPDYSGGDVELHEALPATFALARRLACSMVIVFGFRKAAEEGAAHKQQVIDTLRTVAAQAKREKIVVAVENEPGFWCDSGHRTAELLAAVDSPWLRANWDPANAIGTHEVPYPDGYRALKPWIANVHVKDSVKGTLVECVPVGEGLVDWPGQLHALVAARIVPHITIETHCLPRREKSALNLRRIRDMLAGLPA